MKPYWWKLLYICITSTTNKWLLYFVNHNISLTFVKWMLKAHIEFPNMTNYDCTLSVSFQLAQIFMKTRDDVLKGVRLSLEALKVDYIDLYLIHCPFAFKVRPPHSVSFRPKSNPTGTEISGLTPVNKSIIVRAAQRRYIHAEFIAFHILNTRNHRKLSHITYIFYWKFVGLRTTSMHSNTLC